MLHRSGPPACASEGKGSRIDIEVPLRPAIAAMDLEQLALPDQVSDRHRLEAERLEIIGTFC
jgi:hypothetical protein